MVNPIRPILRNFKRRGQRSLCRLRGAWRECDYTAALRDGLGIGCGDTVMVHSSFGNLSAAFSPETALRILLNLVGESGHVLLPYYPSGSSADWLASGGIFDVRHTPSAMGILTNTFSRMPHVCISVHPIKAVAIHGNAADSIIADHPVSHTPYDAASPYGKILLEPKSKTIGLGIEINSMFHAVEDCIPAYVNALYADKPVMGRCRTADGSEIVVRTKVHDPDKIRGKICNCAFLRKTSCPTYRRVWDRGRLLYSVDNVAMHDHVQQLAAQGVYRFDF